MAKLASNGAKNAIWSGMTKGIGRMAGGGAVVGAGYGLVSDDSSVVGGAIKGAAFGGALGVLNNTAFNKSFRSGAKGAWGEKVAPRLASIYDEGVSATHTAVDSLKAGASEFKKGFKEAAMG